MGYRLGIDFGTSTTKVSLRRDNGIPQPLPIGKRGELFMPSVVAYERTNTDKVQVLAIGEDAVVVPETENTHVVHEVKRCLSAVTHPAKLPHDHYPWWNSEKRCVELWSSKFSPQDVILTILSQALDRAVRCVRDLGFGNEVDSFSIRGLPTCLGTSVTAGLETRKVLMEVARRLGFSAFKVENLVEEPILASLSYVHIEPHIAPGENILIYDLGGGTFDTAIIKVGQDNTREVPSLTVFSADGEPFCGGIDIDEALFRYLAFRIAQEELGYKTEEKERIIELMTPDERQKLWNQAREAKEALSAVEQFEVSLPPGFRGKPGVKVTVSRTELEAVVKGTGLIERTTSCVLRAWRRARMFLREESERIGSFYLRDKSSARVEGSVMGLGHNDLKTLITKILLVGGTTRIPFVRQTLASLWGKAKFVPEGIVEPIQACSIGAAWQQQSLGTIVDRLPFSTIVKWDSGQVELYKAFTPTVDFKTLTTAPSINPFESKSFSLPHRKVSVIYKNPDGEIIKEVPLSLVPGSYALRIDLFGRCILTDGLSQYPLPNPYQHPEQKKMWEQLEDGKRQEAAAQREKIRKWLERRPGEDLREVG